MAAAVPLSLLLKVVQSVLSSWPVLRLEAKGRLKVKALELEARLKMLPLVPVARLMAGPVAPLIEVMAELRNVVLSVNREPPAVDLTKPAPKEEMLVEPLAATVNKAVPVEEATLKTSVVGRVEVPWTERVATGEEEPTPTKPLALTTK